ncbi:MAG TPA: alpha/beta fold hydrolase [Edaphobacter sp.]|nr:alpha/beta fold hydrolase [Edaphobacter sp.]
MKLQAIRLTLIVIGLVTPVSFAQKYTVGFETRSFTDDTRRNYANTGPRPLETVIWYPAAAGSVASVQPEPESFTKGMFVIEPNAPKAPLPAGSQKFPLIVLSHGTSSLAYSMGWLGWFLASHGYIVAGVNHHGNTVAEPQMLPQGFVLEWDRPRDLSVLIDKMLADPKFGPRIDSRRIGAVGHSAGGATVIETAGGTFDATTYCANHAEDKNCNLPPIFRQWIADYNKIKDTDSVIQESLRHQHESHRDPRVKAVFAMAPAVGFAFSEQSLRSIHVPVFIVTGAGDTIVDPKTNAERFAKLIPEVQLKIFPGDANHYIFSTLCNPSGEKVLGSCKPDAGVSRAQVHTETEDLALAFFQKNLR